MAVSNTGNQLETASPPNDAMAAEQGHAQAQITFETLLSRCEQIGLIREVIETRRQELCLAYSDVLGLSYGFRTRRNTATGSQEVIQTPCITFIVKKKWSSRSRRRNGAVPKHLLAYCSLGGQRVLCAIPTDVDPTASMGTLELQDGGHPQAVEVTAASPDSSRNGVITCALTRSVFPDDLYVLSCRHVFTPPVGPLKDGLPVHMRGSPTQEIARTLSVRGPFGPATEISLDAQLARTTSIANLAAALGGIKLTGVVRSEDELDAMLLSPQADNFWILTPDGPVAVAFEKFETESLDGQRHRKLIRWKFVEEGRQTRDGHSGSPVTTEQSGGKLVAMHIGRHRFFSNMPWNALSIPAVDFLDPTRYGQAAIDSWEVLDLDEIGDRASLGGASQPAPSAAVVDFLPRLTVNHGFPDDTPQSVQWRLADNGTRIDGDVPEVTVGAPQTVAAVWSRYGVDIRAWADHFGVPVELIIATICTETRGRETAIRFEPGYVSDSSTPHRVSPGLMQTLISTARDTLRKRGVDESIVDRNWLLVARNSIHAGTSYIRDQFDRTSGRSTGFDPPKVACAYNAGSLVLNGSVHNRWKMKQFPIGTSEHADRFVKWFNDCFRLFEDDPDTRPAQFGTSLPSFYEMMRQR